MKFIEIETSKYSLKLSKKKIEDKRNYHFEPEYILMVISLGYPTIESYIDNCSKYDLLDGTTIIKKEIKKKYRKRENTKYKLKKVK